jgi:uncharacterized protein (DUF983 family)
VTHEIETSGRPSRLAAILRQRCPVCFRGRVFRRGLFQMNETCPACGCRFKREPGYFLGAMYFSYSLAIPSIALVTLLLWLLVLPDWRPHRVMLLACVVFLPLVPPIWRYSRILWMHFDRKFDPER